MSRIAIPWRAWIYEGSALLIVILWPVCAFAEEPTTMKTRPSEQYNVKRFSEAVSRVEAVVAGKRRLDQMQGLCLPDESAPHFDGEYLSEITLSDGEKVDVRVIQSSKDGGFRLCLYFQDEEFDVQFTEKDTKLTLNEREDGQTVSWRPSYPGETGKLKVVLSLSRDAFSQILQSIKKPTHSPKSTSPDSFNFEFLRNAVREFKASAESVPLVTDRSFNEAAVPVEEVQSASTAVSELPKAMEEYRSGDQAPQGTLMRETLPSDHLHRTFIESAAHRLKSRIEEIVLGSTIVDSRLRSGQLEIVIFLSSDFTQVT